MRPSEAYAPLPREEFLRVHALSSHLVCTHSSLVDPETGEVHFGADTCIGGHCPYCGLSCGSYGHGTADWCLRGYSTFIAEHGLPEAA